ncbi:hypothetical protein MMC14_002413 [Varicellaria rhodocarpa]|nr:hypothetical protein [Varicellaria rhodocarpa]
MPLSKESYLSNVWKDGIFDGKVVFCTGGAGSICSAQVRALVHLGANACIVGRNVQKTESAAIDIATARPGAKVLGFGAVDVRKVESLQDAVERCVKELGGIDFVMYLTLILNSIDLLLKLKRHRRRESHFWMFFDDACLGLGADNANTNSLPSSAGAAGNFLASIIQLSTNAMKSVIDIDVLGSYNTLKATLPHLLVSASRSKKDGKPGGRIIFVSATIHYTGLPLQTHVSVAKAGVDALSASCAIELGPRGITSNIIAPGPIDDTEGMERLSRAKDKDAARKKIPVGRGGKVKDIADATVYVLGDTGGFVNGQVLVVDGGAWRTSGTGPGGSFQYPDFLLSEEAVTGVKGGKATTNKAKL